MLFLLAFFWKRLTEQVVYFFVHKEHFVLLKSEQVLRTHQDKNVLKTLQLYIIYTMNTIAMHLVTL